MFQMPTKLSLLCVAGLTGAAAGPVDVVAADPWLDRSHASKCFASGGSPINSSQAIANDSSSNRLVLVCPAIDDGMRQKSLTTWMNVHGRNNSSSMSVNATACRTSWDVAGGECQPGVVAPKGEFNLTVPTDQVWSEEHFGDFGYVLVELPAKDAGQRSSLRGVFQAGN